MPQPTPRPSPLPTRVERITPAPSATPLPSPSPTGTPWPDFTLKVGDKYAGLYATEQDGVWVTTRRQDGRYYYRWDDRRWYGLTDRIWFRTIEDLRTVFPGREAAP